MEASPGLDRCADDDELRAALGCDTRDVLAEAPRPRTHDLAPHAHVVRARHGGRELEPLLQPGQLPVEMRIEGQLAVDDERRDEHDLRAAVGRQPAGEIERVLRFLAIEQGDDDAPVADRLRPEGEPPRTPAKCSDVRQLHRISWYGTEARITCGSTSSNRFT
jgi:hypothetical protein